MDSGSEDFIIETGELELIDGKDPRVDPPRNTWPGLDPVPFIEFAKAGPGDDAAEAFLEAMGAGANGTIEERMSEIYLNTINTQFNSL